MGFTKRGNIYQVSRQTGNHDSFLGISFAENSEQANPEVIELEIYNPKKKEVLEQVSVGLESVNQSLGTDYKLSKIYYVSCSDGPNAIY